MAAGPAARRLARELKVDLVRIRGTGSGGRITPEDVQAFVRDRAPAARTAAGPHAPAAEDERWGPVERRALTGIEKAAARHLSASWSEIPHVTHHDLADVTELEDARRRYEAEKDKAGPKLTWTALVVKAVVVGLRAFPRVNSSLDLEREELVIKRYVHVGVAVDTEHGLLVPVLRDADRKTTREIAAEIADARRARPGAEARPPGHAGGQLHRDQRGRHRRRRLHAHRQPPRGGHPRRRPEPGGAGAAGGASRVSGSCSRSPCRTITA